MARALANGALCLSIPKNNGKSGTANSSPRSHDSSKKEKKSRRTAEESRTMLIHVGSIQHYVIKVCRWLEGVSYIAKKNSVTLQQESKILKYVQWNLP
jgi:hypothetical protein